MRDEINIVGIPVGHPTTLENLIFDSESGLLREENSKNRIKGPMGIVLEGLFLNRGGTVNSWSFAEKRITKYRVDGISYGGIKLSEFTDDNNPLTPSFYSFVDGIEIVGFKEGKIRYNGNWIDNPGEIKKIVEYKGKVLVLTEHSCTSKDSPAYKLSVYSIGDKGLESEDKINNIRYAAVDGDTLYLTDGTHITKITDVNDLNGGETKEINGIEGKIKSIHAKNNRLILLSEKGLLYDGFYFGSGNAAKLLSQKGKKPARYRQIIVS